MIRFLRRLFRREKGYRFPNGIPRAEDGPLGPLIEGTNRDLDEYFRGVSGPRPWVIFEDGDDK